MQTELNKVVTALQEFYARETFLFEKDLGERTLTHRLAVHLEKQFSGWQAVLHYTRLTGAGGGRCGCRMAPSSRPTIISENRFIPISWCTSARFPTTCSQSKCGRQ